MDVILLEKVGKLGAIGDKVSVKAGFGRNYLIPQGKAAFASEANLAAFETRRADLEAAAIEKLSGAEARNAALTGLGRVTITAVAGDEGKLFGSVGARDVADAVTAAGVALTKSEVKMPDGAIRELGEFDITVQLHSDLLSSIKVIVVSEEK